jgi:pantoate--beta-alanine ligase
MKTLYGKQELEEIKTKAQEHLTRHGFRVDYAEIADALTLEPIRKYNPEQHAVALIAAFINDVRLIDNLVLTDTNTDSKVSN